jgi:hypothetical protein
VEVKVKVEGLCPFKVEWYNFDKVGKEFHLEGYLGTNSQRLEWRSWSSVSSEFDDW